MPGELESTNPTVVAQLAAILSRIASGDLTPRVGLASVVSIYHAAPQIETGSYVGAEYDIAQLIGYYYAYDDFEERPNDVSFDGKSGPAGAFPLNQEIRRLAGEWVRARYQVSRSGT